MFRLLVRFAIWAAPLVLGFALVYDWGGLRTFVADRMTKSVTDTVKEQEHRQRLATPTPATKPAITPTESAPTR